MYLSFTVYIFCIGKTNYDNNTVDTIMTIYLWHKGIKIHGLKDLITIDVAI